MSEPHGPMKISSNRQIALPKALMDRLHLRPGDMVYVLQSDSEQQGLVVVPVERVSEWVRLGRAAERERAQDPAERMQDDGEPLSD
ncbi:MAG TPA: AbrB/MazE/SpoVT family DNA-binding domain-containing protein [Streptosporangiaceae bacterium]|nr:AbrB/MazE/SpoVT family DNA-binding domain-containing protein [Streptosporangiaceae bacterium]